MHRQMGRLEERDEGTYRQTDRQMRSMIDAHTKVLMDR